LKIDKGREVNFGRYGIQWACGSLFTRDKYGMGSEQINLSQVLRVAVKGTEDYWAVALA
jgi:hypothetical protein